MLLGAHLDSWDLGQGAIDDGAGVAIVIEAARLIGRLERKPARTVRVVLFANEFELSGAREYARLVGDAAARHMCSLPKRISAPEPCGVFSRRSHRKRYPPSMRSAKR